MSGDSITTGLPPKLADNFASLYRHRSGACDIAGSLARLLDPATTNLPVLLPLAKN
jgi:hypothetical protein